MGFQFATSFHNGKRGATKRGHCLISKVGLVTFCCDDLERVDIYDEATPMLDLETRRIALRSAITGELSLSLRGSNKETKITKVCSIRGLIKQLGLDPAAVAGSHPLSVEGELLVINLQQRPPSADREVALNSKPEAKGEDDPHPPGRSEVPLGNLPPTPRARRSSRL